MRVALYLRVSTKEQTTENQRRELEAVAKRSGWTVGGVYEDAGISGANGREKRPAFDKLLKDASRREFDMIAAWSVDRLGRSLQNLIGFLEDIQAKGVNLYLHQQGLDTTTPTGRAMFGMCSVFAEFERAIIRERINAGLDRARANGKTLGRKAGPSKKRQNRQANILKLHRDGQSIRAIAKTVKMSPGTVHSVIRAAA